MRKIPTRYYLVTTNKGPDLIKGINDAKEEGIKIELCSNFLVAQERRKEDSFNDIITITLAEDQLADYLDDNTVSIPASYFDDPNCKVSPEFRNFPVEELEEESNKAPVLSKVRQEKAMGKDIIEEPEFNTSKPNIIDAPDFSDRKPRYNTSIGKIKSNPVEKSIDRSDIVPHPCEKKPRLVKQIGKNVYVHTRITEEDNFVLQKTLQVLDLTTSEFLRKVIRSIKENFDKDKKSLRVYLK